MARASRRGTHVRVHLLDGEAAVTLVAGPTEATFLPELGMLGASLRHRDGDYLDLRGGPDAVRAGHTAGLPLLAPWANRLGADSYRAAGQSVDLSDAPGLHRDANGLPIHGTMLGRSGWTVDRAAATPGRAGLTASFDVGDCPEVLASFPFPHVLSVNAEVKPGQLVVTTSVTPTGRRSVPVSFGWHPYFRVPGASREGLRLGLPARHRLVLDDRQLPTGEEVAEPARACRLGEQVFDDGYRLGGRAARFELSAGRRRLVMSPGRGYRYAQVYAPAGSEFVALEPMTAPTDGLRRGEVPLVEPGDTFSARFTVSLT